MLVTDSVDDRYTIVMKKPDAVYVYDPMREKPTLDVKGLLVFLFFFDNVKYGTKEELVIVHQIDRLHVIDKRFLHIRPDYHKVRPPNKVSKVYRQLDTHLSIQLYCQ